MRKKLSYSIFIIAVSYQFSCGNDSQTVKLNTSDTSFVNNILKIRYHFAFNGLDSPKILESSTIMVTNSMTFLPEYHFLRNDTKYDSANFMNCASGTTFPLRSYSISKDTLNISIYYTTQQGWFWVGKLESNKGNNLIIGQGNHIEKSGLGDGPTFSRLILKIFIPKNYKINQVEYHCE